MLLHQDEDASALGAAMLAWHALEQVDAWRFNSTAAARVFEPNAEHWPVYKRNYRAFSMLYDQLKEASNILREK